MLDSETKVRIDPLRDILVSKLKIAIPVIFLLLVSVFAQTEPIFHGPRGIKQIALTFDACPTQLENGFDEDIIRVLKETKTPATFFLSGKWAERLPEKARELAAEALFEIGNHSHSHPHMTTLSDDAMARELNTAQSIIERLTGRPIRFFRPPYGEWDQHLVEIAGKMGLMTILYDMVSGDPDPNISVQRMSEFIITRAQGGSIVVMHVNGRGLHTAEALPIIIDRLRQRGFDFTRLSALLSASRLSGGMLSP